jgi:hypothetical protein
MHNISELSNTHCTDQPGAAGWKVPPGKLYAGFYFMAPRRHRDQPRFLRHNGAGVRVRCPRAGPT